MTPNELTQAVTLHACILKVSSLNLGPYTEILNEIFRGFPVSSDKY